jgi:hypothetical protein
MLTTQPKNNSLPAEKIKRPPVRTDRRKDQRTVSYVSVIIAVDTNGLPGEFISMTFNHSRGGMCLESAEPFKPGSILFVRLNNAPADQIYHGNREYLRTSTLAEVKWSREFCDKFSTYYRLGVKYY